MKKLWILLVIVACMACKNETHKAEPLVIHDRVEVSKIEASKPVHPAAMTAVFKAHGGLNTWNKMKNLCFETKGNEGTETHTTDLKNRKTKIEHKDWSIGYDGTDVWLLQHKENAYKGNARFYHNLLFYFDAMPFIVGDAGIIYTPVPTTELDGKMYSGVNISYEAGIGDSPEDEYIIYFDPETNKMAWLGYTVTYQSGEKSKDWHFIKYDSWKEINGLLLPEKLIWYDVKDNKPSKKRKDMIFDKITVSNLKLDAEVFEKPEGSTVVLK